MLDAVFRLHYNVDDEKSCVSKVQPVSKQTGLHEWKGGICMKRKALGWVLLLFFILGCASCTRAQELELLFFNAGKADACLLKTAGSTVFIDTGKDKMGKEIVTYLQENGITEIDVLFITHFDKDHVGGADRLLEAVPVHQIYEPAYASESKQYLQYREAAEATGANVVRLSQNTAFELDGIFYEVDVANQNDYGEDEENDFSLVISLRHGENRFLFAGDAENPRLSELLLEGVGEHDLLKVPHHGRAEKLSASFFAAVKPRYSIITSDEENLEEESVVNALKQYGQVYLTRLGAISCISDGKTITIRQQ